jgi:succinate dehydrogenase/fumarate reductase cytochrome b subunit
MLQKFLIIGFLVVILYNLGAGLYYMMVDKGENNRMVRSLTWRIGLSVALIAIIGIGIWSGWIKPHDVGN